MGVELRLPNITGTTEKEQLAQVKSYLFQLTQQLQWALNTLDTSSASNYVAKQTSQNVFVQHKEEDAETSFNELKALIIKSADIVDAYYEEINSRLSGKYVAESDFGAYIEETEQEITETSTGIERAFTNIQEIITDIDKLTFNLAEVNAHIKAGLLYYDEHGLPVYGLEIGQQNHIAGVEVFNKYARFTSDRLSFYDQNNQEVAYVSDYKLYIRNVEITSSFKIGGFVDTVTADGGIVTKWVGGDS
jgi:hypothetical protein